VTSCFVKFVRYYSRNEELTGEILKRLLGYPFKTPTSLNELAHLEDLYDVLDLYLWLSFRFAAIFCQKEEVFEIRSELEEVIFQRAMKYESDFYFRMFYLYLNLIAFRWNRFWRKQTNWFLTIIRRNWEKAWKTSSKLESYRKHSKKNLNKKWWKKSYRCLIFSWIEIASSCIHVNKTKLWENNERNKKKIFLISQTCRHHQFILNEKFRISLTKSFS